MKPPKRISAIINKRNLLLDSLDSGLNNNIVKLQSMLFSDMVSMVISKLQVKDDIILDTAENYKLLKELDKTFESFNRGMYDKLIPTIREGIDKLTNLSSEYFEITLKGNLPEKFARIIESTKILTDLRLGLSGGKMVRGGYVMTLINQSANMDSIKRMMVKAITGGATMSDFIKTLKTELLGDAQNDGKLERQFKRYAFDVYQQHDRSYNAKLAEEFELEYFIYQGGLVKDSRDFCREHNDHVYTTAEAQDWVNWTPNDAVNITEFDQEDLGAHPSYMDYEGYDPLVDLGGYNCRHILAYITEGLAIKWRPELKPEKTIETNPPEK